MIKQRNHQASTIVVGSSSKLSWEGILLLKLHFINNFFFNFYDYIKNDVTTSGMYHDLIQEEIKLRNVLTLQHKMYVINIKTFVRVCSIAR